MNVGLVVATVVLAVLAIASVGALIYLWRRRVDAAQQPFHGRGLTYPNLPDLSLSPDENRNATVVVVTDYNTSAGFGWLVYNALNTFHLCSLLGKHARPVVFFTKGYYSERRKQHRPAHVEAYDEVNWFNNYFEPLEPQGWRPFLHRHFSRHILAPVAKRTTGKGVCSFNRDSLNDLNGQRRDYFELWRKYLRPRKHILARFQALKQDLLGGARFVYAVHYRGTDKYSHSGVKNPITGAITGVSKEDDPAHMPYEWVFEQVAAAVLRGIRTGKHDASNYRVLVSSDEEPFMRQAVQSLGGPDVVVFKADSIRADVSTSGLELDTRLCGVGRGVGNKVCDQLQSLVDASVHRGHTDKSNYAKGEDVLLETMLLSEADVFFRSRGNFSNLPTYMRRNPRQHVVDMASEWRRTK